LGHKEGQSTGLLWFGGRLDRFEGPSTASQVGVFSATVWTVETGMMSPGGHNCKDVEFWYA
jgi:hypothetical protein